MPKSTQTPSSVLKSMMDEYGLNPNSLSKAIGLSYAAVRMLVLGKMKISAPTSLRLAKYFGNAPAFWLSLQQEADIAEAGKDKNLQSALKSIKKAEKQTGTAKSRGKAVGARPASRKKK